MPPIEVRRQAGEYQRTHKDASIVSAFIAGWSFGQQKPYLDATMVDDTPVYDETPNVHPEPIITTEDEINAKGSQIAFNVIWDIYDRKDNKQSALKAWKKLSHNEQGRAFAHIPAFVKAHPDKKFRPMLATYLNQKRFNDEEIIDNGSTTTTDNQQQRLSHLSDVIANYN